jgi:DNA-binding CsgD family transcriptional regulator
MNNPKASSSKMRPFGDSKITVLIRELVQHAAPAAFPPTVEGNAVLVEHEIDGFRYLLVRAAPRLSDGKPALSPREYEIVRMVAKGYPNKVIADVLEISSWTVSTYLRRIFAKLRVGSRAAMVARVLGDPLADGARAPSAKGRFDNSELAHRAQSTR